MAFAKFQENRFRIDGEFTENHAILVNLTVSIVNTILNRIVTIQQRAIIYKTEGFFS